MQGKSQWKLLGEGQAALERLPGKPANRSLFQGKQITGPVPKEALLRHRYSLRRYCCLGSSGQPI